jgi:NADPH:quinone reductase-like Zn-dependent oxidoreductase
MSAAVTSKGWFYARRGPIAEVLKLGSQEVKPAANDAVIKVSRAPLHRTDTAVINGTALGKTDRRVAGSAAMRGKKHVGGSEAVGTVVSAGSGNTNFKAGDTVWIAPLQGGGWADHVVVNPAHCHKIDPKHADLAAMATCLLTAQRLLTPEFTRLAAGDTIVQNGGSSATSLAVSALGQDMKLNVLTAAQEGERFAEAVARHKKFGSTVVSYNGKGRRALQDILAKEKLPSAKLYLNGVGGPQFSDFGKLVGKDSTVVTYGAQGGFGIMWGVSHFIYNNVTMRGLNMPKYLASLPYDQRQSELNAVLAKLSEKKFSYPTQSIKALDDLPSAWDELYVKGGGSKAILTL